MYEQDHPPLKVAERKLTREQLLKSKFAKSHLWQRPTSTSDSLHQFSKYQGVISKVEIRNQLIN